MIFELRKHDTFQITGKGTVFTVHRGENDVEGIDVDDVVKSPKDGKYYRIRGIEYFKDNFGRNGKNIGLLVIEVPEPKEVELSVGNSCGSCIHTNKPKTPRGHAAHYEVAKTERWCFKHQCHVTRETTCPDHEGVNRGAKTAFTRIKKFNLRAEEVRAVAKLMGTDIVETHSYKFRAVDGWIEYCYKSSYREAWYDIRSKESSTDKYMKEIREKLENG